MSQWFNSMLCCTLLKRLRKNNDVLCVACLGGRVYAERDRCSRAEGLS
jgi:hypothetical protein